MPQRHRPVVVETRCDIGWTTLLRVGREFFYHHHGTALPAVEREQLDHAACVFPYNPGA